MWLLALPLALHMVLGKQDARHMLKRIINPAPPKITYTTLHELSNQFDKKRIRLVSLRDVQRTRDDSRQDLKNVCRELDEEDRFTIWSSDDNGISMIVCDASKKTEHTITGYVWSPRCTDRLCAMKQFVHWHNAQFPTTPLMWNVSRYL